MKEINIFLASSIDDLKYDRQEIGNFIRKLNDIYMPDIYFRLFMCEDESDVMSKIRKQEEYNEMYERIRAELMEELMNCVQISQKNQENE